MQNLFKSVVLRGALFISVTLGSTVAAQTSNVSADALDQAIRLGWGKEWDAAMQVSKAAPDPLVTEITQWFRLRAGVGSFSEFEAFLKANADWPGLPLLQEKSEPVLPAGLSPARVLTYFAQQPPQTGYGALRLAEAYDALSRNGDAAAEATRAWRSFDLDAEIEAELLRRYGDALRPYHAARLDLLLWQGKVAQAKRMLPLVSEDQRKLAEVRIALQSDQTGVDPLIAALPKTLRDDAGLAYSRFLWRVEKGYWDSAHDMLVERSASIAAAGRPEFWAERRLTYAGRAMRMGDSNTAYLLASHHFLTPVQDGYSELEWFAGFLALRKLDDPDLALTHFTNFRRSVESPISIGRAGYWLGRAYEAKGDSVSAANAYALGASQQTSFYGQLATERAGAAADASLIAAGLPPDWTRQPFLQTDSVRAGILFFHAGYLDVSQRFLAHASEGMTLAEQEALAQLALDMGHPNAALRIAKNAAAGGKVLPRSYYPLLDEAQNAGGLPSEMVLAIIRQESEFNPQARSSVGARGLMQLMPGTAQDVAKDLGVGYEAPALTEDSEYNIRLGTAYLKGLLERFDGSVILAAAGYNAGPNRVDQWIKDYGDPRSASVDIVDWIETIPYSETRNYVQRVAEALFVYRARLSGRIPEMRLEQELRGGTS